MSTSRTLQPAHSEIAPPPSLISALKKRGIQLQVLPGVAVEAMRIAMNPDCLIGKYSDVIERDLRLATEILAVTNSAAYNPTRPIVTLKNAVVRLGLRKCQNLIVTSSITSMMRRISLEQEHVCCTLWNHSYTTAVLATSLNKTFQLGFQGEEFTAGLIHDIGRTLLAITEPETFAKVDSLDFLETPDDLTREDAILGTDHCRFGAWYANQQRLPVPIPEVILHHHRPELATDNPQLTSLIAVADHMSNHLQRFPTAEGYDPALNPFVVTLARFVGPHIERKFAGVCSSLMDKAAAEAAAIGGTSTKQLLSSNLRDTVMQSMFSTA